MPAVAVARRCSVKTGVFRIFTKFRVKHLCQSLFFKVVTGSILRNVTKFTGKHLCRVSLFKKLQALNPQLYQKRDCGTGVFL